MRRSALVVLLSCVFIFTIDLTIGGSSLLISSGMWQVTGHLSTARADASAVVLQDGQALIEKEN